LKDVTPSPSTTPTPEPKPEGDSFLTKTPKEPDPKVPAKDPPADPPKDGDPKGDPKAPVGAPEKYEDFKVPDGFKFDEPVLKEVQTTFKELGLSQDQAQKLVDLYGKNALEAAAAPYKAWADLQKEWTTEIGNRFPGDKGREVQSMISNVLDTVLSPTLAKNVRAALDITGAGSHPDVVEALNILLRPLSEGKPVRGNGPSPEGQKAPGSGPPSIADALYGHLRK
jgi:hypothetical protein